MPDYPNRFCDGGHRRPPRDQRCQKLRAFRVFSGVDGGGGIAGGWSVCADHLPGVVNAELAMARPAGWAITVYSVEENKPMIARYTPKAS
jgi:hypothetical protein